MLEHDSKSSDTYDLTTLVNQVDAAKFLQIKPSTLTAWRYTQRYSIPFYKIGSNVRYRVSDLLDFLENNRVDDNGHATSGDL